MKTIIYKKLEQKLFHDWQLLWENSPYANYTNSPYWFLAAIKTFKYKDSIIIAVFSDNHLAAIAAFIKTNKYGIVFYTPPAEAYTCGLTFLLDPRNKMLLETLLLKLQELGKIFTGDIPELTEVNIKQLAPKISYISNTLNYYMYLKKDEKGQVGIPRKKKFMSRARNIEKKLSMRTFEGDAPEALRVVFTVDNKSTKHAKGYNTFSDNQIEKFYRTLAKSFEKKFLINILYYEKYPIAYSIGFIIDRTYFASQTAIIKGYEQYSLGRVLTIKIIEYLGSKKIEKIDFGPGGGTIKKSFTNGCKSLFTIIISKNKFTRIYLETILKLKKSVYNYLQNHIYIYIAYRRIKSLRA